MEAVIQLMSRLLPVHNQGKQVYQKGEELFTDYNHSLFCFGCKSETEPLRK
jgi:hypothetical protein